MMTSSILLSANAGAVKGSIAQEIAVKDRAT